MRRFVSTLAATAAGRPGERGYLASHPSRRLSGGQLGLGGRRNVVRRLVNARVRWDWRDARQAGGHPPYDALELYVVLDCDFRERHDNGIYYYRGSAMVHHVPLSDVGMRWQQGPAGPEWDRSAGSWSRTGEPIPPVLVTLP
ncbi:MAG TPA: hypothetical protein VFS20_12105 [Longimicrobium sp.]|nr:hypothetical protein [Longimicrobium sp.]